MTNRTTDDDGDDDDAPAAAVSADDRGRSNDGGSVASDRNIYVCTSLIGHLHSFRKS